MGGFLINNEAPTDKKEDLNISEKAQKTYGETHELVLRALEIGEIKEKDFLKKLDKTKDIVGQIIKLRPKNIKLAKFLLNLNPDNYINYFDKSIFENKEILEILLKKDEKIFNNNILVNSNIFKLLKKDYSKNISLVFLVLNNFVKNNNSLDDVKNFIKEISNENLEKEEELNDFFSNALNNASRVYQNDIKKYLFQIDENIANKIIESNFLDKTGKINEKKLKDLEKEISKNFEGTKEDNKENIINYLLEKFNLSLEDLKSDILKSFLNSFYDLLKINNKNQNFSREQDILENKEKEDIKNKKNTKNENNLEDEQLEQDLELLSFCNGNCILSDLGNNYKIDTGYNKIEIKKEEYKKFSSKSLENYLKFNGILYETGLSFLFEDKYKSGFLQLLNTKFSGFDYTSGSGFSDFYLLQTLNIIAHLIGVPKSYYSDNGKLGEFSETSLAINTFKEINSTGIINNVSLVNPGNMFDCGAAKKRMLQNGVINFDGGFNIITALDILKKGGYKEKSED